MTTDSTVQDEDWPPGVSRGLEVGSVSVLMETPKKKLCVIEIILTSTK